MKTFTTFVSVTICLLLSCLKIIANTGDMVESTDAILTMETEMLDRWIKGDTMGFAENARDNITAFYSFIEERMDGLGSFTEVLESLKGIPDVPSYRIVKPDVYIHGDMAVLSFEWHHVQPDGTPGTPWHATEVFLRTDGKWMLKHSHWSEVMLPESGPSPESGE
jgi:hypothetical protein